MSERPSYSLTALIGTATTRTGRCTGFNCQSRVQNSLQGLREILHMLGLKITIYRGLQRHADSWPFETIYSYIRKHYYVCKQLGFEDMGLGLQHLSAVGSLTLGSITRLEDTALFEADFRPKAYPVHTPYSDTRPPPTSTRGTESRILANHLPQAVAGTLSPRNSTPLGGSPYVAGQTNAMAPRAVEVILVAEHVSCTSFHLQSTRYIPKNK